MGIRIRTRDVITRNCEQRRSADVSDQIAPRHLTFSTGDKRAKDAHQAIRDNAAPITAMNKAAEDLWGAQRAAQNAI